MSMTDGIRAKGQRAAGARNRAKGKGKSKAKPINAAAGEGVILDQLVTQEAQRHGDYAVETMSVTEGDFTRHEKGERSVVRNRSVDVVEVWAAKKALDLRQVAAIAIYRRCHMLAFGAPPRVSADWGAMLTGGVRGSLSLEDFTADKIEAMRDLKMFQEKFFKPLPPYVFDTWQNAVINNLAAGPAGSSLNHKTARDAAAGALTIVRMCSDWIAGEMRL